MIRMLIQKPITTGHSADVRMTLLVHGKPHRITHMARDFLILSFRDRFNRPLSWVA